MRSASRKSRKKEETELTDVPEDEPVVDELDTKNPTRLSRIRKSLRIKKKKKDKDKTEKSATKKEKKEKKSSKWETDDTKVRDNHCEFKVKYLGSLEVAESRGMEVCEAAIRSLKARSTNQGGKAVQGVLHVSGDGLRVVDKKTQGMLVDQVIEKVSFCAPDRNFSKGFAYISRDGTSRRWVCHGFLARRESGERLSHAVGVAFAVCLERKQSRECEGVTGSWDEASGAFTRFGSFRQGTLTERLADPQGFKVTPLKEELGLVAREELPFAIQRPRPGDGGARGSLRGLPGPQGLASIKGQSPFKRGSEQYNSLRPQDLPSTAARQEKSRVSLILEETFDNEETKNEINAMMIMMAEHSKEPLHTVEEAVEEVETKEAGAETAAVKTDTTNIVAKHMNNNETGFKVPQDGLGFTEGGSQPPGDGSQPPGDDSQPPEGDSQPHEPLNPWDLVPDQPRLKGHSRTNSSTHPADRWLASLTARVGDQAEAAATDTWAAADPLEEEWAALANRNQSSTVAPTNPFRACV